MQRQPTQKALGAQLIQEARHGNPRLVPMPSRRKRARPAQRRMGLPQHPHVPVATVFESLVLLKGTGLPVPHTAHRQLGFSR
jgi:hypothetical protein